MPDFKRVLMESNAVHKLKRLYGFAVSNLLMGRSPYPFSVVLILTYRCNCRCKMCFYYNESEKHKTLETIQKHKELSLDEIKGIIDEVAGMGARVLTLHGGEPLIRKDFVQILKHASGRGMMVRAISNGALINDELAAEIVKHVESFCFSVDGPKEVHDAVRGKGTFNAMLKGIQLIQNYRERFKSDSPHLAINTVISSINQKHLVEVLDIAIANGIKHVNFGFITSGSAERNELTKNVISYDGGTLRQGSQVLDEKLIPLSVDLLKEQREAIRSRAKSEGMKVIFPSENSIEKYSDASYNAFNRCYDPWVTAVISPYGEVYPCVLLSFLNASMGNVRDRKLSEIWNSGSFVGFRRVLRKNGLLPACSKCCAINSEGLV